MSGTKRTKKPNDLYQTDASAGLAVEVIKIFQELSPVGQLAMYESALMLRRVASRNREPIEPMG